ncbi:MAG TPA: VRR-NUC domain-containing protein, partial [Bordetella sp.]|nr:VRR-NUC domain-containing protein [Bordetella sp.]
MAPSHRYYYLHNFQQALQVVADRYADLIEAGEQALLAGFRTLPQASQALFVRMAMRRGPWFRASRLIYDEIPDLPAAALPLLARGWLDAAAPMTLDELFGICTLPELRAMFAAQAAPGLRKADLLAVLRQHHDRPRPCAEWCGGSWEPTWRFMPGPQCDRLRLMFFGNLRQDWSEFVLADLGVFRYETVAFPATSRAFQSRADVDRYLALHACRQALDAGTPMPDLLADLRACASGNVWLEQRRAKMLLRIGQACERAQDWDTAQQVYQQCGYPGARHRRIRVYERMARHGEALALALQAQAAPENEAESQRLARMLPRLRRNAGLAVAARPAGPAPRRLDLGLPRPAEP